MDRKYDHDIKSLRGDEGARSIVKKNINDVEEVEVNEESVILDIDDYKDYIRLKNGIT
ncbi:MAG: hypothetical protein JRI44_05655 [Deltaproteobacteria bacterium]|nr:hypothetical protein [Deltaproteobacteria bacterium]